MYAVQSKNGARIRLPNERWIHITEEHAELAGHLDDVLETIADPFRIYAGTQAEMLAVREITGGKFLVVVYKEIDAEDGFVITAFLTRRLRQFRKETDPVAQLKVNEIADMAAAFVSMPFSEIWYHYDRDADVLYLNFKKPSHADDSEVTDDDLIIRYNRDEVVGITVLHASKRHLKAISG